MAKAVTASELERLQAKTRRLMRGVVALQKPFTTVTWQEWIVVPWSRARQGMEASALAIAERSVEIINSSGPVIKALGGNARQGWDVGEVTAMHDTRKGRASEYVLACFVEWRSEVPAAWNWQKAAQFAMYGEEVPIYSRFGNPHETGGLAPV